MRKTTKKRVFQKQPAPEMMNALSWLEKVAVLLAGFSGTLFALLWIMGRAYASGYFGEMNIKLYQLNFSIWEYAEQSWWLVIPGVFIAYPMAWIADNIIELLAKGLAFIASQPIKLLLKVPFIKNNVRRLIKPYHAETRAKLGQIRDNLTTINKGTGITIKIFYTLCILLILAYFTGIVSARSVLLHATFPIELLSSTPQELGTPAIATFITDNETSTIYTYSGYKLLTQNDGKYYFYQNIDPKTCKPDRVFIVSEEQFIRINLLPITPAQTKCDTNTFYDKYLPWIVGDK